MKTARIARTAGLAGVFLAAMALLALSLGGASPGPALAVPANDNFADAITITTPATSGVVATGSNAGATSEVGEPGGCSATETAWYNWTSPGSPGTVVFDTWGSDFDTVLAIHTGNSVGALTPATSPACNDDFGTLAIQSALVLTYAANTTYRIQLGGYAVNSGNFVLSMATGSTIFVNDGADNNVSSPELTLREAMLLARGGIGAGGLNRALSVGEANRVLNPGAVGAAGSDLIHFALTSFPSSPPATIALVGSALPDLNATGDVISSMRTGVIVDGQDIQNCFSISGSSNRIEGIRMIRCNPVGVAITGPGNTIGGSLPAQRNVINQRVFLTGVTVAGAAAIGNVIKGNYIGTDATGTAASAVDVGITLAGGSQGTVVGGTGPGDGNLISGATGAGNQIGILIVDSDSNIVQGNKIGTNAAGTGAIPNNVGVNIGAGAQGNIIGGVGQGEGNIIAFNLSTGVQIQSGGTATVKGNSIHSNGGAGISSTIAGPTITTALGGTVAGTACALCIVDVYDDSSDEGRIYRATTTADAVGNFSASGVPHTLANYTATNTDASGLTSGFSAAVASALNTDGDGLPDTTDPCGTTAEDYDGFQDADGCPETDNDADGIPDTSDIGKACFDAAGTLACHIAAPSDCRNVPEDLDAFKDGDGCPEPDNDNDSFPDGTDACPGADASAGADGMFGAPQDANHNGVRDGAEAVFTTDDVMPLLMFEDKDGVLDTDGCHDSPGDDFDGDGFTDDAEVFTHLTDAGNPDTDADTVADGTDNCPNWANAGQALPTWTIPALDSDCDGFTVAREQWMGTNPTKHCNLTTTTNDEAVDFWPTDFNDSRLTSLADVVLMGPVYNQSTGTDPAKKRFDLNASGIVSLADVVLMGPFYNKSCA